MCLVLFALLRIRQNGPCCAARTFSIIIIGCVARARRQAQCESNKLLLTIHQTIRHIWIEDVHHCLIRTTLLLFLIALWWSFHMRQLRHAAHKWHTQDRWLNSELPRVLCTHILLNHLLFICLSICWLIHFIHSFEDRTIVFTTPSLSLTRRSFPMTTTRNLTMHFALLLLLVLT